MTAAHELVKQSHKQKILLLWKIECDCCVCSLLGGIVSPVKKHMLDWVLLVFLLRLQPWLLQGQTFTTESLWRNL